MYVGWRSDELSGHATEVLKAKCTWLVVYIDCGWKRPDFLVDLLMHDKDRVSPCSRVSQADPCGAQWRVRPSNRLARVFSLPYT
jgi:hypothetical protein